MWERAVSSTPSVVDGGEPPCRLAYMESPSSSDSAVLHKLCMGQEAAEQQCGLFHMKKRNDTVSRVCNQNMLVWLVKTPNVERDNYHERKKCILVC